MRHTIIISEADLFETHSVSGRTHDALRIAALRRGFPLREIENGDKITWSQTRLPTGEFIFTWDDGKDSEFINSIKEACKATERGMGYKIATWAYAVTAAVIFSLVVRMCIADNDNATLTNEQDMVVTELCKASKQCLPSLSKEHQEEFNNRKSSTK